MATYRLLWVDDEIELLGAHILFLRKKGYEVRTVSNGHDALDCCAGEAFDLILLDEYSFDDYKQFYDAHFAPMRVPGDLRLDEPTDLKVIDPDDAAPEEEQDEGEDGTTGDDFPYGF